MNLSICLSYLLVIYISHCRVVNCSELLRNSGLENELTEDVFLKIYFPGHGYIEM
jgi:hypothetical protein